MPKFARNRTKTGSITDPAELKGAQQKLFLRFRDESFYLERKSLLKSSPINKTSTILKLPPFIGPNGLLCAKGSPQLLEFAKFGKNPVILDARHPLLRLFLKHLHEKNSHHGAQHLMV